mgnify:CR=1 FL=1
MSEFLCINDYVEDEAQESYDVEFGNIYSGNAGLGTIGSRVSAGGTMSIVFTPNSGIDVQTNVFSNILRITDDTKDIIQILKDKFGEDFSGKKIVILGGTGPVGVASAVISAKAGNNVLLVGRSLEKAETIANICNEKYGSKSVIGAADAEKANFLKDADVVFNTGAAGIQLMDDSLIANADNLKICADVNAVPPAGKDTISHPALNVHCLCTDDVANAAIENGALPLWEVIPAVIAAAQG